MDIIKTKEQDLVLPRRKKRAQEGRKSFFEIYKSPKTLQDYLFYLKDFLSFVYDGDGSFQQEEILPLMKGIEKEDVEQYIAHLLQERNMKKTSLNKVISAMKSLYKELEQYQVENPFRYVKLFKTTRNLDNILKISSNDIKKIIEQFQVKSEKDYRNLMILYTLYYTGMRSDELLHMEFRHLMNREGSYFLKLEKTKSGREQYKPLHPALMEKLQEYKKEMKALYQLEEEDLQNHFVFCSHFDKNKALSYRALYDLIKSLGLSIEKDMSPHNIRHAIATELSLNGADLVEIRDFLGHADTKVTEIYINAKSILEKRVLNKIPDIMEEKNSSSSK
ncbi:tyrosine-type recombinase/integrase [Fusobacterium gonidiaformans]|uniref:tyrosine-type recombinase/integrase n=1 Tax=Fusobacterium gonidiaformans TaxID=849 RepID=UPI0023F142E5|nr:tyrosine-type recombinase/integrase [Fusobacterium gonidiaformans]